MADLAANLSARSIGRVSGEDWAGILASLTKATVAETLDVYALDDSTSVPAIAAVLANRRQRVLALLEGEQDWPDDPYGPSSDRERLDLLLDEMRAQRAILSGVGDWIVKARALNATGKAGAAVRDLERWYPQDVNDHNNALASIGRALGELPSDPPAKSPEDAGERVSPSPAESGFDFGGLALSIGAGMVIRKLIKG